MAADFTCIVEAPEWIGDIALQIVIETFGQALDDVTIKVFRHRDGIDTCPPDPEPDPVASFVADIPAGQILTIDGAVETVERFDKAAKRVVASLDAVTPGAGLDLIRWPRIPGACQTVCVVVDYTGAEDPDGATVEVHSIVRET